MKFHYIILYSLLFLQSTAFSQNFLLISLIESIKPGESRFTIDGLINKIDGLKEGNAGYLRRSQKISNGDSVEIGTMVYSNIKAQVGFKFCNDKVYFKAIAFAFSKGELENAKSFYNFINEHIQCKYKYLRSYKSDLTNKTYGGKIGESIVYIIFDNPRITITVSYSGILNFQFSSDKTTIHNTSIDGYQVCLEFIDVSNVELKNETEIPVMSMNF